MNNDRPPREPDVYRDTLDQPLQHRFVDQFTPNPIDWAAVRRSYRTAAVAWGQCARSSDEWA